MQQQTSMLPGTDDWQLDGPRSVRPVQWSSGPAVAHVRRGSRAKGSKVQCWTELAPAVSHCGPVELPGGACWPRSQPVLRRYAVQSISKTGPAEPVCLREGRDIFPIRDLPGSGEMQYRRALLLLLFLFIFLPDRDAGDSGLSLPVWCQQKWRMTWPRPPAASR